MRISFLSTEVLDDWKIEFSISLNLKRILFATFTTFEKQFYNLKHIIRDICTSVPLNSLKTFNFNRSNLKLT